MPERETDKFKACIGSLTAHTHMETSSRRLKFWEGIRYGDGEYGGSSHHQ